jgi:hypothetical protein
MNTTFLSRLAAFVIASPLLLGAAFAAVPGMKVLKLTSPDAGQGRQFGVPCVLTDRYAVVSDQNTPYIADGSGCVRVYDAATGALVRTLIATYPTGYGHLGRTLAVHGNLVLANTTSGHVFLFDLSTGKQLRTFLRPGPPDPVAAYGDAMQLTERYAIISFPGYAVYVYDLANTNPPLVLNPPDPVNKAWYGVSVYCHDNVLLVGHIFPADNKGVVFRYDLATGQLLESIKAPDGLIFDRFGSTIAGAGQTAFIGIDPSSAIEGKAYPITLSGQLGQPFNLDPDAALFRTFHPAAVSGNLIAWNAGGDVVLSDVAKHERLMRIKPSQLGTTSPIGGDVQIGGVGLAGNRLLLGCRDDDSAATDAGAAFLIQTLPEPLPTTPIATKGDSAPGPAGIAFNDLKASAINSAGRVVLATSLSGPGSNAGKDSAVFDDLATAGFLDLAAKSRDDFGSGVKIASVAAPVMNSSHALFTATLTGTGVTTLNNRSILRDNGTAVTPLLRTGTTLPAFAGATLSAFGQLAQSGSVNRVASTVTLRSGIGGTTAANDSGLAILNSDDGSIMGIEREGQATNIAGVTFGQFIPRVSFQNNTNAFTAMVSGPAAQNQAVFTKVPAFASFLAARKGSPAPDISGAVFSSFLAENLTPTNQLVFRATVTGAGITTLNNQGIWYAPAGTPKLIARTGYLAPVAKTGVVWSRFLQICPQTNRLLIRALLRGPGITATNDEIVCLYQEDETFLVLYREGEMLAGCNGARGGPISRLEAHIDGHYSFLMTLAGASASTNLALLGGDTFKGTSTAANSLRRPELKLRKGRFVITGQGRRATLTSLALASTQTQDTSGMSCKGLSSVTGSSGTVVKLTLSDGTTQIAKAE